MSHVTLWCKRTGNKWRFINRKGENYTDIIPGSKQCIQSCSISNSGLKALWGYLHLHLHLSLIEGTFQAPQMISQPVSSIFLCSPLPSGTWRTPGPSISWYCLPISFSICFIFFSLSLCLARWFRQIWWMGYMSILLYVFHDGLRVVRLPTESWQRLLQWWHGLCMRCVVSCGSTLFS